MPDQTTGGENIVQNNVVALSRGDLTQCGDFWCPARTGDWAADNITGRLYADRVISELQGEAKAPNFLGSIVRDMVRKGIYSGVEVGFFQRIAEVLITPATSHPTE